MPQVVAEAPARPAREYESIYVLRPDIDAELAARVADRVSDVIGRESGMLVKVESWGRRRLAYPVRKYRKGVYVYVKYLGRGNLVAELERNFRMQKDAVLKFITVKVRDNVSAADVTVDPEEIKFAPVEPASPGELEEPREKLLGLIDAESRHARDYRSRPMPDEPHLEEEGADEGADDADMDEGDSEETES